MLYDPKWEQPKPDIFALDTLIGWLGQQPPTKPYSYSNPNNCLLAQYFTAMDGGARRVSRCYVFEVGGDNFWSLPPGWNHIAEDSFFPWRWQDRTFRGALKRAKRLRAKAAVGSIFARIPQLLGLT